MDGPWRLGALAYFLAILPFGRIDLAGWPGTLVSGQRLLLPVLPLLILGYSELIGKFRVSWLLLALAGAAGWVVAYKHWERTRVYAQATRLISGCVPEGSVVMGNREVIRLLGPWNRLRYSESRGDYVAYVGYPRPKPREEARLRSVAREVLLDTTVGGERLFVGAR